VPPQDFDREIFVHMPHPLDGNDVNMAASLETLWSIQHSLKELRRYLRSKGNLALWDHIPCSDATSGELAACVLLVQGSSYHVVKYVAPVIHLTCKGFLVVFLTSTPLLWQWRWSACSTSCGS
jgi:hypothetical protein